VTINENGGNQPFEVFISTSKGGSETAAVAEAIGRLISYVLRLASPVAPRERLQEVMRQLSGIGGGRSWGFGSDRVRSLPDGVSHALREYTEETDEQETASHPGNGNGGGLSLNLGLGLGGAVSAPVHPVKPVKSAAHAVPEESVIQKVGDLCPECGQAAVINEEGCRKCYACGHSEC
jgi:ribonucleoside-diphosphate reductase alpha chain